MIAPQALVEVDEPAVLVEQLLVLVVQDRAPDHQALSALVCHVHRTAARVEAGPIPPIDPFDCVHASMTSPRPVVKAELSVTSVAPVNVGGASGSLALVTLCDQLHHLGA